MVTQQNGTVSEMRKKKTEQQRGTSLNDIRLDHRNRYTLAKEVLKHRIHLDVQARLENINTEQVVEELCDAFLTE